MYTDTALTSESYPKRDSNEMVETVREHLLAVDLREIGVLSNRHSYALRLMHRDLFTSHPLQGPCKLRLTGTSRANSRSVIPSRHPLPVYQPTGSQYLAYVRTDQTEQA